MADKLKLFKVRPKSFISKLASSKLLLDESRGPPGENQARLLNLMFTRGRDGGSKDLKKTLRGKTTNYLGPLVGKKLEDTETEELRELVRNSVKSKGDTEAQRFEEASKLWVELGADPETLRNLKPNETSTIINAITYVLSLPHRLDLDASGFNEDIGEPLAKQVDSFLVQDAGINEDIVSERTRSVSTTAPSAASVQSTTSIQTEEERVIAQKNAEKKAREAIARGEAPAQGAGSAASVESFMSQQSFQRLQSRQTDEAEGPSGGTLPPGSSSKTFGSDLSAQINMELFGTRTGAPSEQSVESLKNFVEMFPGLTSSGSVSLSQASIQSINKMFPDMLSQDSRVSSDRRSESVDSFLKVFPSMSESSRSASFSTDRDYRDSLMRSESTLSSSFPGISFKLQPQAPPSTSSSLRFDSSLQSEDFITQNSTFFETQQPQRVPVIEDVQDGETYAGGVPPPGPGPTPGATTGGAGTGAGAPGGGGSYGPNNNDLERNERDARLARMIAEQNAKLAVEILKSQKKKGLKPFLSTEDMNEITFARNLDARQMKAENLFKDYQNANNQELQRLIELQRRYNDMYRVPIAK